MKKRYPPAALLCSVAMGAAWATQPATEKPLLTVTLVCEAIYLPARSAWERKVRIGYDQQRVRSVEIDGLKVYAFAVQDTIILTAVDNERIRIDTAALTWSSDFRGLATAQGRCERSY